MGIINKTLIKLGLKENEDTVYNTPTEDIAPKETMRYDIINHLIKKNNFKSYLEIGVRNPDSCFNQIQCESKQGVDPGVEGGIPTDYVMTSDVFFSQNQRKYDLIFVDGLHVDEQVKRDIDNALKAITPKGIIVLHDCNPPDIYHAREDFYDHSTSAADAWNGTVWKAIVDFRASENALKFECNVVNTDYGVGIISPTTNGKQIINDNPFYAYRKFERDRERYLGLISVEQFFEKYS